MERNFLALNRLLEMVDKHIAKRESLWGRWTPVVFYSLNVALWFITGVMFEARDLLYLAVLTLPALGLFIWRTR